MSLALANYLPDPPQNADGPAPRGTQLITLETAHARSKLSLGQLRRLCLETWSHNGLAVKQRNGAKAEWMVWEHADARFARTAIADRKAEDLTDLTEDQRQTIQRKTIILREWKAHIAAYQRFRRGASKNEATDAFLQLLAAGHVVGEDGKPVRGADGAVLKVHVSRPTLYNWAKAAEAGSRALADHRSAKDAEQATADDPYFAEVRRWWLHENQPSIARIHSICNALARREEWAERSYFQVSKYIKSLPKPAVALARKGEEEYNNIYGGFTERDYTTLRVNQIWCGDHHPCDVIVHFKGRLVRPWLSAWEDMRSRRVFYCFTPQAPDSSTVINALANGIRATGMRVPETAYIDNGKDYDCYTLQGVTKAQRIGRHKFRVQVDPQRGGILGSAGIDVLHARPYNPKAKPVERFFRTYSEAVDKFEPTYTGNKPANKPEGLEEKVRKFNEAVRTASPGDVARGIGHCVPAFEDYVARASAWIEECYHREVHTGHGMEIDGVGCSPMDIYNYLLGESANRVISEKAFEIFKLRIERTPKVGRNGQITVNKLKYGRGQPEMRNLQGQKVIVRLDPADIKQISIWSLDGNFLCHATECGRVPWGTSREAFRAARRKEREEIRAAEALRLNPAVVARSATELLIENAIHEQGQRLPPPPPAPTTSFRPVQTGFERDVDLYEASAARAVAGSPLAAGHPDGQPGQDMMARLRLTTPLPAPRSVSAPATETAPPSLLERMRRRTPNRGEPPHAG